MDFSLSTKQQARQALGPFLSGWGIGLPELAERTGLGPRGLSHFSRGVWDRDGSHLSIAHAILDYIAAHPIPQAEGPGALYETAATRDMDKLLAYIARGGWGTLYGPAGAQKTFWLQYRAAELAKKNEENPMVYIRTSPSGMSPSVLLRRIGQALLAPYAQDTDGLRQAVLDTIRRRRSSFVIALDEAQHFYDRIDTIETLREIGDLVGTRAGILVAGNEDVLRLFEPRRRVHFEQWRSRIQQREVRVLGPSHAEARSMILGELPGTSEKRIEALLAGCAVKDPVSKREYINARRLFNTLRDMREPN